MSEPRMMTIYFTDGTDLKVRFPKQDIEESKKKTTIERILNQQLLVLEGDGAAYMFPYHNIKYIKLSPSDMPLPDSTVRGIQILS